MEERNNKKRMIILEIIKIKETLKKDINRNINGVVKAENNREDVVVNELEEYVVTEEVREHLHTLFDRYSDSITNKTEDMGIWLSGFFGSGKSHLLKMLGHIIDNKEYNGIKASGYFEEKVKDHMLQANIEKSSSKNTDVILFNIDNVSDQDTNQNKDSIVLAFQKKFNEYLGFSRDDVKVASLERMLWEQEKFQEFKEVYKEKSHKDWTEERRNIHFVSSHFLDVIEELEIKGFSGDAAERWLDDEKEESVNPESFCDYLESYLKVKGPEQRILFLVDEIGQYIGDNVQLMLNLQTLVENLGVRFRGRVWVGVTSQQDIDGILKESNTKRVDFAKIQGRFKTMLSLSSGNIDEVIKKRLLEKRDVEKDDLENLYENRRIDINNLISFSKEGVTQKLYNDKVDFAETYPFVGYQFSLLQKVLDKVRNMGHSGKHMSRGERSLLSAFQEAGMKISEEKIGALVPFSYFFSSIEHFLEDTARRPFIHAKNEKNCSDFEIEILRLLFLLKGIDDTVAPTLQNITSFMIDSIDCNKVELEKNIKSALKKLQKEVLIQKDHDNYYFLTNEEQDINREIEQEIVDLKDEYKLMEEIIFEDILESKTIIVPETENKYEFNRGIDDETFGKSGNLLDLKIWTPRGDNYGKEAMLGSRTENHLIIKLPSDEEYFEEIRMYKKVDMYLKKASRSNQRENIQKIIESKQRENKNRNRRIIEMLKTAISHSEIYISSHKVESKSVDAKKKLQEALQKAANQRFKSAGLINKKYTEKRIQEILQSSFENDNLLINVNKDLESNQNKEAIKEIKNRILLEKNRRNNITIHSLSEHFKAKPFGWDQLSINGILAELWTYKMIEIEENKEKINDSKKIASTLVKTQTKILERTMISLKEEIDLNTIKKVEKLAKQILGNTSLITEDSPAENLINEINKNLSEARGFIKDCDKENLPGKKYINNWIKELENIKEYEGKGEKTLKVFLKYGEDLEDAYDEYEKVYDFFTTNKKGKYQAGQSKLKELEKYNDYFGSIKENENFINLKNLIEDANPFKGNKFRLIDDYILEIEAEESKVIFDEIQKLKGKADKELGEIKTIIKDRESILHYAEGAIKSFKDELDSNINISSLTKGKKLENIIDDITRRYKNDIKSEILSLQNEVDKELKDKDDSNDLKNSVSNSFKNFINDLYDSKVEEVAYIFEVAKKEKSDYIAEALGKRKKKERKIINRIQLVSKSNLEKEEEVEDYINSIEEQLRKLKEDMLAAVKNNKIVDIK